MRHPSFVLLFQEAPRAVDATCGPATSTHTSTRREDPDTDIGVVASATQTRTEARREEPDTDPYRAATLGLEEKRVQAVSTATRTDAREEPDQDTPLGVATCFPADAATPTNGLLGLRRVGERSFLWTASAIENQRAR